jgi:spore germination protein YaaH
VTGTLTAANLSKPSAVATPAVTSFADAVTQLVNGNTYTNVHTVVNPGGEIRGQNL